MCAQPFKSPPDRGLTLLIALSILAFVCALLLFGVAAALLFAGGWILGQVA